MAEKVSFKIFIVISLLCGTLSACFMAPVDIEVFMSDPQVQEIIATTKETVKIHEDSDGFSNLKVEGSTITGLTQGKYYRVEEYDKDKNFTRNLFLQSDGKLNGDLGKIGLPSTGKIEGLTNNYWYKLKWAEPFDSTVPEGTYKYFTLLANSVESTGANADVSDDNGITKITVKIKGDDKYYLDLSHEIKVDNIYEVMNIGSWTSSRTSGHFNSKVDSLISIIDSGGYTPDFTETIGIYQYRNDNDIKVTTGGKIDLKGKSIIELSISDAPLINYVFVEHKVATQVSKNQEITGFTVLRVELKQTPTISDFEISGNGTVTYDGAPKAVTVTPKDGKSNGTVTYHYKGTSGTSYDDTTAPTDVGTYTVTFDVADTTGWDAVTGLPAGTLTIQKATPVADDFDITGNNTTYNGSSQKVTVTPKKDGMGTVTVKYDGSITAPTNAGTYPVTFDVAENTNWNAVTVLSAGTLTINKATPVAADFNLPGDKTVTYNGSSQKVTVTPKKDGMGDVTVKYDGSTTEPTGVGTYTVTFDVAVNPNWNAATELLAGTLTIEDAHLFDVTIVWSKDGTPNKTDFTNNSTFNEITGALKIDITIPDNWTYYEWTADHTNTKLTSEDNTKKNRLLYNINAYNAAGLVWSTPEKFTITLVVDNKYSVVFIFTSVP